MRVCFVTFANVVGVSNVAAYEYATRVSEAGNDVHLIALRNRSAIEHHQLLGVGLHSIESLPFYYISALTLTRISFLAFARSTLQKIKPDVVHVYATPGVAILPATMNLRCKWLYDVQSVSVISNFLLRKAHNLVTGFEASFFDKILIVDRGIRTAVPGTLKAEEFPLGVNLNLFRHSDSVQARARLGLTDSHVAIIYSGTMHPSRRLDRLLEGFKIASEAEPSLRLVMLGDPAASRLDEFAQQIGIENKTIFFGPVPYGDVPKYLSACDIGISYIPISGPYYFQPALKTLEYLACGLPTIATDTMGNRRVISDGDNGILTSDEPDWVSGSILRLARDASLRHHLSQSARSSIERFDWSRIVNERLLPIYERLLRS